MLVRGAVFAEGTPKEIGANPRRPRGLSRAGRPHGLAHVELKAVSAGYGETVVLEDINLSIAPGESVGVIGRNGVGKTTLLSTIMGHTTLHKGEVATWRARASTGCRSIGGRLPAWASCRRSARFFRR